MMVSTGSQSAPAIDEADLEQRQTLWVGGLNEKVTEQILYELFMNAGPLISVRLPVDKETKRPKNFAFVRFQHAESVPYAVDLFRDVRLFGQSLRMQNRTTGAGMPNNQNRYQQPAMQARPGQNGFQSRGIEAPPVQVWQNHGQGQGQAVPLFHYPSSGQVSSFQVFQSGGHQGFGGGNFQRSEDETNVPHRDRDYQHQHHRDRQVRHSRDEHRHQQHHQQHHHHHHRSHSDQSRGFNRGQNDHHHRDRSYDSRYDRRRH